jgi:hypothetical protein
MRITITGKNLLKEVYSPKALWYIIYRKEVELMKVFSTDGIHHIPKRGEEFRIGWFVGTALMVTKKFIIAK